MNAARPTAATHISTVGVLVTKWLHERRFTWPPIRDDVMHLSATQLTMLLDGLEWTRVSPEPVKQPAVVG
jgi:transposase